jgi:hypothetical protein
VLRKRIKRLYKRKYKFLFAQLLESFLFAGCKIAERKINFVLIASAMPHRFDVRLQEEEQVYLFSTSSSFNSKLEYAKHNTETQCVKELSDVQLSRIHCFHE